MLKRNFNFYADAGHGWLEVTPTDLERVGMKVSEFSNFSYKDEMQKSCIYYLEEDKDCWQFLNRWHKSVGDENTYTVTQYDMGQKCWVRDLAHINW